MEKNMGILAWILVGLIAGWLAGQVMKGGGYGMVADIVLGLLGGVLGGWIFREARSVNRWRNGRLNHCCVYRRRDFGRDYPLVETSVTGRSLLGYWNVFVKSGVPV